MEEWREWPRLLNVDVVIVVEETILGLELNISRKKKEKKKCISLYGEKQGVKTHKDTSVYKIWIYTNIQTSH